MAVRFVHCYVNKIHTFARGMIAKKLKENRRAASQFSQWDKKLSGTKSRNMFSQEPKRKYRKEAIQEGSPSALIACRARW